MPRVSPIAAVLALGALVPADVVRAQATSAPPSPPDNAEVDANGNPLTGGLRFSPEAVVVRVGGFVRWTNTDFLVPHTATEEHDLWDVGGTYGQSPLNPGGFGPGAKVQRTFEASTASYYCRVHPTTMRGTVRVPVRLSLASRRTVTVRRVRSRKTRRVRTVRRVQTRYFIDVIWATTAPAAGRVFDVQIRRGGGPWQALRDGTTQRGTRVSAGSRRGTRTTVRARLRLADSRSAATGWSPETTIARP
jgi:plastocyanin